jgi:hypothetical protein
MLNMGQREGVRAKMNRLAFLPLVVLLITIASLFSACGAEAMPTANDEEYIVYITATGTKYHVDGCQYLSKSKIATPILEAMAAGYEPCTVCNAPGWWDYD